MDFFNGFGKKLSGAARSVQRLTDAARSVQEFTRDSLENSRLAADLRAARSELDQHYVRLGQACFAMISGEIDRVPEEAVAQVRAAIDRIEALSAQQDAAARQRRCPGCGSVQSPEARYCSNCGRRMPEEFPQADASAPPEDVEYCPECGAMRYGAEKYCSVCSHPFEAPKALPDGMLTPRKSAPPVDAPEAPDSFDCD